MATEDNEQTEERLARARKPAEDAIRMHAQYRGKIETVLKCPVRSMDDFSVWYSPGVAAPCLAIQKEPDLVYDYTWKWNTVAVISDGSRVLGLGDIGPKAGLPVMEGKSLLYRYLGAVDSVPIMLDTKDPDEIIRTVLLLQPSFGGINLEDLSQPKCFRILETLREQAEIPVWHDDQQGTATVTLAGLLNALKLTGREIGNASITFVGVGAANVACARLIFARGADPARCRMVDSRGVLGMFRQDIEQRRHEFSEKWNLCRITNSEQRQGGIEEALRDADVVISLAQPGPGTIQPEWIRGMRPDPIVFACANPVPEIWPWEATEAGAAVVATGRSDFPNQVNNSLCFPGIFRGALDVRARTITDEMCFAAADALCAAAAENPSTPFDSGHILPSMEAWEIFPTVAAAVGTKAIEQGVARLASDYSALYRNAYAMIRRSRELTRMMMDSGFIEPEGGR